MGKTVGAAAAPTPLNTPSLRRENNGKDISVLLVPTVSANGVWGSSSENKQSVAQVPETNSSAPVSAPVVAKPAPWARVNNGTDGSPAVVTEVRPKAASAAAKSWADAESDEDDEDDGPPPSHGAPLAAPTPSQQSHYVPPMGNNRDFRDAGNSRPDHHAGLRPTNNYQSSNRGGHGGQQQHGDRHDHSQQYQQRETHYNSNRGGANSHYSSYDSRSQQHQSGGANDPESAQQRAIEASRLELEQLESRKMKHQQEQQQQREQLEAQIAAFERQQAQQKQALHQQQQQQHSQQYLFGGQGAHPPQRSLGGFGGQQHQPAAVVSNSYPHHQHPPQQQQQYSGSGLLNSGGADRDAVHVPRSQQQEEPQTWERAKKKPIEAPVAPPAAINRCGMCADLRFLTC